MRLVRRLLMRYGDGIPPEDARKATASGMAKQWHVLCDCKNNVVSAARREQTDWYLWTIKNVVTKRELRGKGLGSKVTRQAINASIKEGARALAADITFDNKPSIRIFKKAKFRPVSEFCWKKGEKPAYVLHFVSYPPSKGHKFK